MALGNRNGIARWMCLGFALAGLYAASRFLPADEWITEFTEWVRGQGTAGLFIFAGGYVLGTLLFIPGSLLTLAASVLFGFWQAVALVWLSATIGAALAFLTARYAARNAVTRLAERNRRFRELDSVIGEQGWKIVLLLRLSPVIPFNLSNYVYGLTKIKFWPYVLASFAGMLPGTLLYVYLGHIGKKTLVGSDSTRSAPENLLLATGLAATIAVTVYLARLARQALAKAAAGRERDQPKP